MPARGEAERWSSFSATRFTDIAGAMAVVCVGLMVTVHGEEPAAVAPKPINLGGADRFLTYVAIKLASGKWHQVHPMMYGAAALFAVYFAWM